MSRQATIETPFPTLKEIAHVLGVSVAQAERVQKILDGRTRDRRMKTNGKPRRRAAKYAAKRASKRA